MAPTLEEYEIFIDALPARYPVIQHALLNFIRLGPLTATVRADVAGYIRLMEEDEETTIRVRRSIHISVNRLSAECGGDPKSAAFLAS